MKHLEDEAYVLRTQELGETDLIVTLLTPRHGRVRGVAKAARKSRRRFGGVLEPLTRARAGWTEKEGRELHRLDRLEFERSYATMQAEPLIQAACAVLAEVSGIFAHEGQAEERSFQLLTACLDALESGAEPFTVLRYYEYWTLRLHGLFPDLASCGRCANPLEAGGPAVVARQGLLCRECLRTAGEPGRRLDADALEFLAEARRRAPADVATRRATGPGGVLETLLRGRLESFAERAFRSYRHLRTGAGAGPEGRKDP